MLLTSVEAVRAVLPEMTERGDGAVLLTHGYSALQPIPYLSGVGPVMSAEHYWDMYTRRDRVEQVHPASLTPQAGAAA
ncbi:hypothetical protein ACTMTI_24775 [Nonomuraea sp. H19]|uniref:hypothetical protein n=1 Tax=Nonomuraea sp. H19 TaxID=3452206 RepID=UPI003F8BDFBE